MAGQMIIWDLNGFRRYSSHLLQPLDISCFGPLKHYYGQKTRGMAQNGIHAIDKMDFLSNYTKIHAHAFSKANILSGFAAAGLIPFEPKRVLAKPHIKMKTNTTFLFKQQSFLLFREGQQLISVS